MRLQRWMLAIGLLLAAGCNDDGAADDPCDARFERDAVQYCVVIEEGFVTADCPDGYAYGERYGEVFVCADGEQDPDAVQEELAARGYGDPADGGTPDAGADVAPDVSPDVAADIGEDGAADTAPDADAPDVRVDTGDPDTTDTTDTTDTIGEDVSVDAELDGDSDVDVEVLECLSACSEESCPEETQVCGDDGEYYCNACERDCYGASAAEGGWVCDCPDPTGAAVAWEDWVPPEPCMVDPEGADDVFFSVATNESEFGGISHCDVAIPSGIDWETYRLVRVFAEDNLTVFDARERDGTVFIHTRSQAYCGGAAPMPASDFILIPAGASPVDQASCTYGRCFGPPPP